MWLEGDIRAMHRVWDTDMATACLGVLLIRGMANEIAKFSKVL
jgi:hypothetical protein